MGIGVLAGISNPAVVFGPSAQQRDPPCIADDCLPHNCSCRKHKRVSNGKTSLNMGTILKSLILRGR